MAYKQDFSKYLVTNAQDEKWGLLCTTVGCQNATQHAPYPVTAHPSDYNFTKNGRILDEYQLVYITEGEGWFQSDDCEMQRIEAGTILLVFPGKRHLYYPNPETGWREMWVGFRGPQAEAMADNFFSNEQPLLRIGVRESIVCLYREIMELAQSDVRGCQQVIAGIIAHLLGRIYYDRIRFAARGNKNTDKINQAQLMLRENITTRISPAEVAERLSMSYSLLRNLFKQMTGVSMSSYQQHLKLNLAKELLSNSTKNISEIAYETGFESVSRFCCFFRQHMQITATEFRNKNSVRNHKNR